MNAIELNGTSMLAPYGQLSLLKLGTKVGDPKFTAPLGTEIQGPPIPAPQGAVRTVIRRKAQAQA